MRPPRPCPCSTAADQRGGAGGVTVPSHRTHLYRPHWRDRVTIVHTVPATPGPRSPNTACHRIDRPLGKTRPIESMEVPRAATVYPGCRLRARVPEGALPARRV